MLNAPIGVAASRVRYEEKRIFAALEQRGIPYEQIDTRRLSAEVTARSEHRYAAVLNREISQNRGIYATALLQAEGVRTINTPDVIAVCGDKLRTSQALVRAGLPTPRTVLALTPDAALEALETFGYPVVIKPLSGSWGRLAAILHDRQTAEALLEHRAALPSPQQRIIYLQELIEKPDRDIRVLVAGERAIAASYRISEEWRTNAARGARSTPCPLTPDLTKLALDAARAVGGGVLGVDVIEDRDGTPYVLEVNHTVEFRALQKAHGDRVDVAGAIVDHVLEVVSG